MITKKQEKNKSNYLCKKCNFKCSYKSEFERHLKTAKHIKIINDNNFNKKNKKYFYCNCGKKFNFSSGLSRHKKKCLHLLEPKNEFIQTINNNNNKTTNKDQLILDLLAQNKELISILNETVPKIGNNNTTNNNNTFNLNVFLNEDCKDAINFSEFIDNIQVSFADLEHQSEIGYVNGISKLFIENLQELGTYKRPIHCTDKKRKTLYIKENDTWDKEGSQNTLRNGIQEVSRKGFECLSNEKKENTEEYQDIESDFSQKCLLIQRNLIPNAPRETTINKVIENISKKSGIIE